MNDRKQHVIKKAHQLFIDKGFQSTSIQDILDYSGISKGTFYNYFTSKNELLIALFKSIYKKLEKERDELLMGQESSNIDIFIKQIELTMKTNRKNKLISLFEEVMFSTDEDLKEFLREGNLKRLSWVYHRFIDIFGEDKKPYLLDCAIMFNAILQQNIKYQSMTYGSNVSIHQVVRYSVDRIVKMTEEVAESGDQLIQPELIDSWIPSYKKTDQEFHQKLHQTIHDLKKAIDHHKEKPKYIELLDFIQEELLESREPRRFMVESVLFSLKAGQVPFRKEQLDNLDQLVHTYFNQIELADK